MGNFLYRVVHGYNNFSVARQFLWDIQTRRHVGSTVEWHHKHGGNSIRFNKKTFQFYSNIICHSISVLKDVEYLNERKEQSDCEVGEPVDCPSYHECGRPLRLLEKLSGEDKWNPTWNRVQQVRVLGHLLCQQLLHLQRWTRSVLHTAVTSAALQLSLTCMQGLLSQ